MAYPVREEPDNPLIHRLVYQYGTPSNAGVITEVIRPAGHNRQGGGPPVQFAEVKIKWLKDGSVTTTYTSSLNDYEELVKATKKKLETHETRVRQLRTLRGISVK